MVWRKVKERKNKCGIKVRLRTRGSWFPKRQSKGLWRRVLAPLRKSYRFEIKVVRTKKCYDQRGEKGCCVPPREHIALAQKRPRGEKGTR